MGHFFGAVGLAFLIWLASLVFKFSFATGFVIWIVLAVLGEILEAHEQQQKEEAANSKKCSACAEPILKEARKCKHCGEMQ